MLPEPKGSMSELFLMEGCPKICLWWTNVPQSHRVSMTHEIIQGSEASGVMFGDQQGSLVLSVSILTRKAIQAVEQMEVVFGGQQDSD